jgi:hypothetical protein
VIGAEVRRANVSGSDETSGRVDGVTYWAWVFQTATAAYHCIGRRRNTAVVLAFLNGVIPQAWGSDLWKPQLKAGAVLSQICLAHPLRDLAYTVQAETADKRAAARAWAEAMAALVRRAIHTRTTDAMGQMAGACCVAEVGVIEHECDTLRAQPLTAGWSYDLQTPFLTHRRGLPTSPATIGIGAASTASSSERARGRLVQLWGRRTPLSRPGGRGAGGECLLLVALLPLSAFCHAMWVRIYAISSPPA